MRSDWYTLPDRLQLILAVMMQMVIVVLVFSLLANGRWMSAFAGMVIFALTLLPALLEHQLRVFLPVELTLLPILFLTASFVLGEVSDFYNRIWWWDLMLHSTSAVLIGIVGFLSIYVFHMTQRIVVAPIYVATYTLCIAVTVGTLWEIFEFSADWFLGLNMQKSGLVDTMTDLIVNLIGALIASSSAYAYVKDGDSLLVDRLIRNFLQKNPKLFRKKHSENNINR